VTGSEWRWRSDEECRRCEGGVFDSARGATGSCSKVSCQWLCLTHVVGLVVRRHTYAQIHTHIRSHTRAHTHTHARAHTNTYAHTHARTRARMHACMHMHTHTPTNQHTNTRTNTYARTHTRIVKALITMTLEKLQSTCSRWH